MGEGILYLCDGENENCTKKGCYLNGGECKHTKNIRHAKNFQNFLEGSEEAPLYVEKEKERTR